MVRLKMLQAFLFALTACVLLMIPLASGQDICTTALAELNSILNTKINPSIHKLVPDPLSIDVGKSDTADAGCIIPNPFGGCICHASAGYNYIHQRGSETER